MRYPPHKYNPYILQDIYEEYIKYTNKYSDFRQTFTTFSCFLISHKKHKPESILYRHAIRIEARKHHRLYD